MRVVALLLTAGLAACGGASEGPPPQAARPRSSAGARPPSAASSATSPGAGAGNVVEKPEPPEAQALAEQVVGAEFNRDKTTRLAMNITTLVGRTSALTGFATSVAPKTDTIEAQLTRLGAKVTETEVVIQLPGSILFDFDSANIRPDAHRALTDVSQVIKSYANRPVRVEGHTDSVASDEYNQGLSERRAKSVADWLAANGVERGRLAVAGFGEKKPVATNDTAAGRQQNRRVEVVIAKK
jgi:outer membrane protein OmpA-like peptidoglycan-associated protein